MLMLIPPSTFPAGAFEGRFAVLLTSTEVGRLACINLPARIFLGGPTGRYRAGGGGPQGASLYTLLGAAGGGAPLLPCRRGRGSSRCVQLQSWGACKEGPAVIFIP